MEKGRAGGFSERPLVERMESLVGLFDLLSCRDGLLT